MPRLLPLSVNRLQRLVSQPHTRLAVVVAIKVAGIA
jgi:hypothetical protein